MTEDAEDVHPSVQSCGHNELILDSNAPLPDVAVLLHLGQIHLHCLMQSS